MSEPIKDIVILGPSDPPSEGWFGTAFFDLGPFIQSMDVSLSMSGVSQLSIVVSDPGLVIQSKNILQVRRWIVYLGMTFEISVCEIRQGSGGEEVILECRSKPCQEMKREKGRNLFTGGNATLYAGYNALLRGMRFFGEDSGDQQNVSQVSNDAAEQSVWDVIQGLASQNQFVFFETDNRLFFTSQQFLLGKYAVVGEGTNPGFLSTPIRWFTEPGKVIKMTPIPLPLGRPTLRFGDGWPGGASGNPYVVFIQRVMRDRLGASLALDGVYNFTVAYYVGAVQAFFGLPVDPYQIGWAEWNLFVYAANQTSRWDGDFGYKALEVPNCRRSDDDYNAATVNFQLNNEDGRNLRPGMTIQIVDINDFFGYYLVNEVRWQEGTDNAVSISASTPQEPDDPAKAEDLRNRINLSGGGFANITGS
jgi:hypothetical protein